MVIDGYDKSLLSLHDVLSCFYRASGMVINDDNFTLLYVGLDVSKLNDLKNVFYFSMDKLEMGLKYIGFRQKPCRYFIKD